MRGPKSACEKRQWFNVLVEGPTGNISQGDDSFNEKNIYHSFNSYFSWMILTAKEPGSESQEPLVPAWLCPN